MSAVKVNFLFSVQLGVLKSVRPLSPKEKGRKGCLSILFIQIANI